MKKKDQILLEKAYQKVFENTWQPGDLRSAEQRAADFAARSHVKKDPSERPLGSFNLSNWETVETIIKYYTQERKSPGIDSWEIKTYVKPGNYDKMKEFLKKLGNAESTRIGRYNGVDFSKLDKKALDEIAQQVQNNIKKVEGQREETRKEKVKTEISLRDSKQQTITRQKLEAVGFKRLTGDEYKDYDKDGRREISYYYGKTIGSLLGRSREELVVKVNPNGSIGEEGMSVDDYLQFGKGKRFAQSKKSIF